MFLRHCQKNSRRNTFGAHRRQLGRLRLRFEPLEDRRLLSAIAVTTFADVVNPSDGKTSLREAIDIANSNPGVDTICLKQGTYNITIPGAGEDANATGDFDITESVKIVGDARCGSTINGNGLDRVFDLVPSASGLTAPAIINTPVAGICLTLQNLKVTGGLAIGDGGGIHGGGEFGNAISLCNTTICGNSATGAGGGIYDAVGNISLATSHVDNNTAGEAGGGIYLGGATSGALGRICIQDSTVNGNSTGGGLFSGGGIWSSSTDSFIFNKSQLNNNHSVGDGGGAAIASVAVTIADSCVNGNTSGADGGGVYINYFDEGTVGAITVSRSTFSNNVASGDGGGLDANGADVTVDCSTFSCNQAGFDGGGIANAFTVEVISSNFVDNSAMQGDGGGIEQGLIRMTVPELTVAQLPPQSGDISILKSTFKGNFAGGVGGGISATGDLDQFTIDITKSSFVANTAVGDGGGLYAGLHSVNVCGSTFDGNVAGGEGGGIHLPEGSIFVFNSCFNKNVANTGNGGGFNVETGDTEVACSTISGNTAGNGDGGGFYAAGSATVTNSTISCNTATGNGGGFAVVGAHLILTGSTLDGNRAGNFGGGAYIATSGTGTDGSEIINSTLSGNSAQVDGGGFYFEGANGGELTVKFATIAFNIALDGGGFAFDTGTAGALFIEDTIVAKNTATNGPDAHSVGGSLTDLGHNLVLNDTEGLFSDPNGDDIFGQDPLLGPLANNGGKTKTHALLNGSPAINAGVAADDIFGNPILTDQRGVTRDATPDIGAYEYTSLWLKTPLASPAAVASAYITLSGIVVTTFEDVVDPSDGKISLREAIDMANANPGIDTICLKKGTYNITIPGAGEDANATGDFDITESVKIVGDAWCGSTINGNGLDRVLDLVPPDSITGVNLTLQNLKITGGLAIGDGGGIHGGGEFGNAISLCNTTICGNNATGEGGGIFNVAGNISLLSSHVDNNTAGEAGGGIYLGGDGTIAPLGQICINGSTVNGNSSGAVDSGGGIWSSSNAPFILNKSQLSNNHSVGDGGGALIAAEVVTITDSCVNGNTSGGDGGGLDVDYFDTGIPGAITITRSTFSKNRASGEGGGLSANGADVNVICSTFSYNQAGLDGGGINDAFTIVVTGSSFLYNSALQGNGGGINQDEENPEVRVSLIQQVEPGDINICKSTFKGNFAGGVGGGIASAGEVDDFTIDITNSSFVANTAVGDGGGLYAGLHSVNVCGSTFDGNVAGGEGGGIHLPEGSIFVFNSCFNKNVANTGNGGGFNVETGDTEVACSTISGNTAGNGDGGGFYAAGSATVTNSTISCNTATGNGGGFAVVGAHLILTGSTLDGNRAGNFGGGAYIATSGTGTDGSEIINSTLSGNSAQVDGGGFYFEGANGGELTVKFATIAFNIALDGGGFAFDTGSAGALFIEDTIVAKNTATNGPDVHAVGGSLTDLGHNLIFADPEALFSDPNGDDIFGLDPLLGPLANNGGKTKTHALLKGSPAINAGIAADDIFGNPILTDQRGVTRNGSPDIGAYEYVAPVIRRW